MFEHAIHSSIFPLASDLLRCSQFIVKRFYLVDIKHVPRLENQEANDLTPIASDYRVSKEKLEELIKVKEKLILTSILPS